MRHLLTLALAVGCMISSFARAADKTEDGGETIVYFADKAPVVVRLNLFIDGKPHREAWSAYMDEVWNYLDVKKAGKLTAKEAQAAPPAAVLASPTGFIGGQPSGNLDADKDGTVTKAELRDYYRKNGLPPFQISTTGRQDGIVRLNAFSGRMGNDSSPEAVNNRLFDLLDTDKDGKLSKKELAAAPAILAKHDRDDDDLVTSEELLNRQASSPDALRLVSSAELMRGSGDQRFQMLTGGKVDRNIATAILKRYGKGKQRIEVKEVGLAELDRDQDGWLDSEELARLGDVKAQLELTIRLGKRGNQEELVAVTKKSEALKKVEKTDAGVALTIENARIELRGPEREQQEFRIDFNAQYRTQFTGADTDNNGYLDKAEAERSPLFRNLFAVMDRDGDGMLYEKEMMAYLEQLDKLRKTATKACCSLVIRDQGKGLFDIADQDGDGRLSVRELRQMSKALLALDSDGDACLAKNEVPRSYRAGFEEGSVSGNPGGRSVLVFAGGMMPTPPAPKRTKGPLWFRKMDRNRDGDVSMKEWLGTAEEFAAVDRDKDGLVSADEAEAFDKAKREQE